MCGFALAHFFVGACVTGLAPRTPAGVFASRCEGPPPLAMQGHMVLPMGMGCRPDTCPAAPVTSGPGSSARVFPTDILFMFSHKDFFSPQAIYISPPPPKLRLRKSSRPEVEVEAIFFIQKTYHPAPARAPFWCHCHEPSRGCCQRPGCQLPTPHPTEAPPHMPPPTQAPTRTLLGLLHQWVPTRTTTPPSGTTASMAQPATPMPVFLGVRPWIDCVSRARDAGSANACKF